ncbi:MAG: hypothetical protein U0Q22_18565 [Acidimicrobiales bacterium]
MSLRSGALLLTSALLAATVACQGGSTGDTPSFGRRLAPYPKDVWVELPASPLGSWPNYGWVYLADGSGFVHAGAGRISGQSFSSSKRAALFSFADRRFRTLPDLPVSAGVGSPSGARVGDRLVVIGQDCPPMPPPSGGGIEFCAADGAGAKVVLTTKLGDARWRRIEAPDWLRDFRWGSPTVLGVRKGRVIVSAGETDPVLAELDPVSGDWTRIDAPSNGGYEARCLVGDDIVGYPGLLSVGTGRMGPASASVLRAGVWTPIALPDAENISTIVCSRHGLWLTHDQTNFQPENGDFHWDLTITWFDLATGTETVVRPHQRRHFWAAPGSTYGDTLVSGGAQRTVLLTPKGARTLPVGELAGAFDLALVGRYLISTNRPARIMALDVG